VELKVTVDGQEGAALGVMSQGELHSLALSLFIPRATLPESPFRFVVIDDPVQSMDPARVDGLPRILEAASQDRQVVLFTHDDRLHESVRRLGIAAIAIEITRREGSVVEPRRSKDPVSRYIEDAMAPATPTASRRTSRAESSPACAARPSKPPAWRPSAAAESEGESCSRKSMPSSPASTAPRPSPPWLFSTMEAARVTCCRT